MKPSSESLGKTRGASERRFISDALSTTLASVLHHLANSVVGFVNAAVLGPAGLGVLKVIGLIASYAGYSDVGLMKGLYRNLPMALGAKDSERAERIVNTTVTAVVAATALAVVVIWLGYSLGFDLGGDLTRGLVAGIVVYLIADRAVQLYDYYLRSTGKFAIIARRDLLLALLNLAVGIPLVLAWGVPGVLTAWILFYVFQVVYVQRKVRLAPRIEFDLKEAKSLVVVGGLMSINAFGGQVFWTTELTLIAILMTPHDVGIFGFALGALSLANVVPASVNKVFFQDMAVARGDRNLEEYRVAFRQYVATPWTVYLLANAVAVGSMYFVYAAGVHALLPQYVDSLALLPFLIAGYMFYSIRVFASFYLNLSSQLIKLTIILLVSTAFTFALDYVMILRWGLLGAAISALVGYLAFSIALGYVALRQVFESAWLATRTLMRIALAFSASLGALWVVSLPGPRVYSLSVDLVVRVALASGFGIIQIAVFSLATVGVFLLVFRDQPVLEALGRIVGVARLSVTGTLGMDSGVEVPLTDEWDEALVVSPSSGALWWKPKRGGMSGVDGRRGSLHVPVSSPRLRGRPPLLAWGVNRWHRVTGKARTAAARLVPSYWTSEDGPDYLIVGLQKSGTYWLVHLLNGHPELSCLPTRGPVELLGGEGHFFDYYHDYQEDPDSFKKAFWSHHGGYFRDLTRFAAQAREEATLQRFMGRYNSLVQSHKRRKGDLVGEKTPEYVFHLEFIRRLYPSVKMICILRDPRDRTVSFHFHQIRKSRTRPGAITDSEVAEYGARIVDEYGALLAHQGSLLAMTYEDLSRSPEDTLRRILAYLEVPAGQGVMESMLASGDFRRLSGGRSRGEERTDSFYRKGVVGDGMRHLNSSQQQILVDMLGPATAELESRFGLDLSAFRSMGARHLR